MENIELLYAAIFGAWMFLIIVPYGGFFIAVCIMGGDREIGVFVTFLGCLFLSPFLMAWIVSLSERESDAEYKRRMITFIKYRAFDK